LKLIIAVVQHEDAERAVAALNEAGVGSTRMASSGGFLRQGNVTLMMGVDDSRVQDSLRIIRESCHERSRYVTPVSPVAEPGEFFMSYPVEVTVGGATVFVVPVDSFEKI
jgi:uncharacterized protein YaaQ